MGKWQTYSETPQTRAKLEYSLRLKIKRNDWLLADTRTPVCKQPIIALYFESKNEPKFYYLEARCDGYHFVRLCIPVYVLASMERSNIDPFDYKVKYEANTRYKKLYLKST